MGYLAYISHARSSHLMRSPRLQPPLHERRPPPRKHLHHLVPAASDTTSHLHTGTNVVPMLCFSPLPFLPTLTFSTSHSASHLRLARGNVGSFISKYLLAAYRDGPALENPSTTVIFFRSRGSRPIAASTLPARGLGMPHTIPRYALRTVRALN